MSLSIHGQEHEVYGGGVMGSGGDEYSSASYHVLLPVLLPLPLPLSLLTFPPSPLVSPFLSIPSSSLPLHDSYITLVHVHLHVHACTPLPLLSSSYLPLLKIYFQLGLNTDLFHSTPSQAQSTPTIPFLLRANFSMDYIWQICGWYSQKGSRSNVA